MDQIYLNGEFLPGEQACISVMDRGFLFGDGVYEVIPAYGGLPFRLKQHLDRLEHSLRGIGMTADLDAGEWTNILEQLLQQRPGTDQQIYLQITRGTYPQRAHAIPEQITPTVMAMATPLLERDPAIATQGLEAVTIEDIRWHRCDIKSIALLANILSHQQARDSGAQEAILVRDGLATEGSAVTRASGKAFREALVKGVQDALYYGHFVHGDATQSTNARQEFASRDIQYAASPRTRTEMHFTRGTVADRTYQRSIRTSCFRTQEIHDIRRRVSINNRNEPAL